MRIGQALQAHLQETLEQSFGKRRAAVAVRVTLGLTDSAQKAFDKMITDFNKDESSSTVKTASVEPGLVESQPSQQSQSSSPSQPNSNPMWLFSGVESAASKFALPGFPAKSLPLIMQQNQNNQQPPASRTAEQQPLRIAGIEKLAPKTLDPTMFLSAGVEIKRLDIQVLLDRRLPKQTDEIVRRLILDILSITPERGDHLSVARISFPSAITEMMRDPDTIKQTGFFAGLILILLLIGLMLSTVGLFFTRSLSNTAHYLGDTVRQALTVKRQAGHPKAGQNENQQLPASAMVMPGGYPGALPQPDVPLLEQKRPGEKKLDFDFVTEDTLDKLSYILQEDTIENVAIVLSHIRPEFGAVMLSKLPKEMQSEIMDQFSQVKVVEVERIYKVRLEYERKLKGALGGIKSLAEWAQRLAMDEQQALYRRLKLKNPRLAEQLREQLFFWDDLANLSKEDMNTLLTQVKLEDMALALAGNENEEVLNNVRSVLAKRTLPFLEQWIETFKKEQPERCRDMQLNIAKTARQMVLEGRLHMPRETGESSVIVQGTIVE